MEREFGHTRQWSCACSTAQSAVEEGPGVSLARLMVMSGAYRIQVPMPARASETGQNHNRRTSEHACMLF